jgi:hypothetical protein
VSIVGTWDTTISSPVGDQSVTFEFSDESTGIARHAMGSIPLQNVRSSGDVASFQATITSPMKLTLNCSVTIDADQMTGTARAGLFGSFAIVGRRQAS